MSHTLLSSSQLRGLENKNTQDNNTLNLWRGTKDEFINGSTEPLTWYCYPCTTNNTSLDWKEARVFNDNENGSCIAFAKDIFVVVANSRNIARKTDLAAYSEDGMSWTKTTLPSTGKYQWLVGGDKGFVAIDYSLNKSVYSADGKTWVQGNTICSSSIALYSLTYGDGKFVAVSNKNAYVSTDGITWTEHAYTENTALTSSDIIYGGGKFLIIRNTATIWYSTDATNWTETTTALPATYTRSITYGNNMFLCLKSGSSSFDKYYTSTDGITWSYASDATSTLGLKYLIFCDGIFVFYDSNYKWVYGSTDGVDWTEFGGRMPTTVNNWDHAAYGHGMLVISSNVYSDVTYAQFNNYVYTLGGPATVNAALYSAPNTPANLTVSSISGNTITASNNKTYTYDATQNRSKKATVGTINPEYLCFVDNKEISINNIVVGYVLPKGGSFSKVLGFDGKEACWEDGIPHQTSHSGDFLSTDGKTLTWTSVLPSQSGNSGKYLKTNGSSTSWATIDTLPTQTGNSGKYLTTNGTVASWVTVDALPSQAGQANKFLKTDGTSASWTDVTFTAPVTEKYSPVADTSTLELSADLSKAARIFVYYNGLRLAERIDLSDTIYDYYITAANDTYTLNFKNTLLAGSVVQVDIFYNTVQVEREPSEEIELTYPFTNHSSYLSNVTSGSYPFVIDSTKQALMSGSTSYNTNFGVSWGYIQFTTPNYPTTLHVEGYASSEDNYDWGAIVLSYTTSAALNSHLPTDTNQQGYATALRTTTPVTTTATLTNDNPILIFKSSGANTTSSSVDITLDASTTYYLHLIYKKDTGSNGGDDRFYITNVRFTVPA